MPVFSSLSLAFFARQYIACLARHAIVRPSVSRADQSKMVEVRIMKFSPYGSPTTDAADQAVAVQGPTQTV